MSSLAKLVFHVLTTARIMKMGARSRYANRADVNFSWPSPERRDWNLQTVACAAGGVPGDPLTVTLTLV